MIKDIVSFDEFINPNGNLERFKNKNLDLNELDDCSYVRYLIIKKNDYFVIEYDKVDLIDYYFRDYFIFAINCLDNIVCEVVYLLFLFV